MQHGQGTRRVTIFAPQAHHEEPGVSLAHAPAGKVPHEGEGKAELLMLRVRRNRRPAFPSP